MVDAPGKATVDTEAVALATEQAAGLRALADLITRNPEFAPALKFSLGWIYVPLISGDARATLTVFHRAAAASEATVTVTNGRDQCSVIARFGPVAVKMAADAAQMGGQQPAPAPQYAPLNVGVAGRA